MQSLSKISPIGSETSVDRTTGFGCPERGRILSSRASGVSETPGFATPLILTLPVPPSVNQMYANNRRSGGRHKTKAYVDWQCHASWRLDAQIAEHKTFETPIVCVIQVERANSQADIDNRIKALFDLLTERGVMRDDSLVTGYAVAWGPKGSGLCRVALMPETFLNLQFHPSTKSGTGGWFIAPQLEQETDHGDQPF